MVMSQADSSRLWERRMGRRLDRMSKKLYNVSARYGWEPTLYFTEARLLAYLCGQRWFQQRYCRDQVTLIRAFLQATGIINQNPTLSSGRVIQQALFNHYFLRNWLRWASDWQPNYLERVITIHGETAWREAYQPRKGVILTLYHALPCRLVTKWLANQNVKPLLLIRTAQKWATLTGVTYSPATAPFLRAQELHAAKVCLEAGGVVCILPDVYPPGAGIAAPIFQRMRSFSHSFAELALLTGASVLPVSAVSDLGGRIEITFHAPMDRGEALQTKQQVEYFVRQYAIFLQKIWADTPGNITLEHIDYYLQRSIPITAEETDLKSPS